MKKTLCLVMPLLVAASSMAAEVTFQVHMDIQEALGVFDPAADEVVVRGSFNGWGGMDPLLADAGDLLYTGMYDIDDGLVGETIEYKYVIVTDEGDIWEGIDNRSFVLEEGGQVLDPVYYNDQDEVPELLDVEILFRVNMEVQVANGSFDPETDWVCIRGDHANLGNWGGAVQLTEQGGNPGHYFLEVQFDALSVEPLEYKFVVLEDGDENQVRWESLASNRTVTPSDEWPDDDQDGYLEHVLDEVFFDNTTWDDVLAQDVTVHFTVDLWPVEQWFIENPGQENQGLTSFDEVDYVAVCGPWNNWPWDLVPEEYQLMPSTGTLFEGDILFAAMTAADIIYKYGANGADNEAGFQADWTATIDDAEPTFDITNLFGALGDYWFPLDVEDVVPPSFELSENYPNPFNPSTTIRFVLRSAGDARLTVSNILGQEMAVLSEGFHAAGEHFATFQAEGLPSGVYFYTLESAEQTLTQKMLLTK